jgi:DNA ligase-1
MFIAAAVWLPKEEIMSDPQVLYKRTNAGKVQVWWQEINEAGDSFRTVSGQQDGVKVESAWTLCESKNVGRSNVTSPQQQCAAEVKANYVKKLAQGGYCERVEDIDLEKEIPEPMLAKSYGKDPKKVVTGIAYKQGIVYSQPKLDGMRCVTDSTGMQSRLGKPILSAPHIFEALAGFFQTHPDVVFDGELYGDKLAEDFQTLMSIAKRTKNFTEAHFAKAREYLQYHIYDLPSHSGTFSERSAALREMFATEIAFTTPGSFFRFVPTDKVRDEAHLNELNDSYLEQMLEGQMVRLDNAPYEYKRTWQLQKRKVFITKEFRIKSITPGVGNRAKVAGRVTFWLDNGTEDTANASIKGNFAYAKKLLEEADQYVDGECTIQHVRLTDAGKPYPAVCIFCYKGKRDV